MRAQKGFTLIELLVASFLFVVVMAITYRVMIESMSTRVALTERSDRFRDVQLTVQILSNDLFQMQPRSVRGLLGEEQLPPLLSGNGGQGIELTTGGWHNPAGQSRSMLQRVGYELEEDVLYRSRYPVLDRTQATVPARTEMLDSVTALTIVFITDSNERVSEWPPGGAGANAMRLPRAVEFTLELEDLGVISRLIEVAQ